MRFLIAGLALAVMMATAQAQVGGGAPGGQGNQLGSASQLGSHASQAGHKGDDKDDQKVKANDKAYNAALRNLPNKQYDPWHGVR
jgi:hypothetical protein